MENKPLLTFTLAMLSGLWFAFLALGSPTINNSNQICFWSILVISIVLLARDLGGPNKVRYEKNWALWGVIVGLAALTLQLVSAFVNNYSLENEVAGLGTLLLGFIAVSRFESELVLRSFYLASASYIVLGWGSEFLVNRIGLFDSGFSFNLLGHRFTGLAVHPNTMGLLCALVFAISLWKYRNFGVMAISLASLVFSENRGGLLAVFLILALWTYSLRGSGLRLFGVVSLSVIALLVTILFGALREGASDLTSGRLDIWAVCQEKISQGRVFGLGPNTIARMYGVDTVDWFRPFHCHNQVLDDAVNYGIIAALINLFALGLILVACLKRSNYLLVSVFLIFAAAEIFESPIRLFSSSGFIWINLVFFTFYSVALRTNKDSKSIPNRSKDLAIL